jgi:hypothetical protein
MKLRGLVPNSYSHVSARDLYIPTIEYAYFAAAKKVDWSWEDINRSQIDECGNLDEAAQFRFWEYLNWISFEVQQRQGNSVIYDSQYKVSY